MNTQYDVFIDELIRQRKFPDLTDEVREELRRDVKSRLDNFF